MKVKRILALVSPILFILLTFYVAPWEGSTKGRALTFAIVELYWTRQVNPPNPQLWSLVRHEGVDFVLHGGDLTYLDDPEILFSNFLNKELSGIPLLNTIGNYDSSSWSLYSRLIAAHNPKTKAIWCTGDIGIQSVCGVFGVIVVQTVIEENNKQVLEKAGHKLIDNVQFIQESFEKHSSKAHLRICHFHHPHINFRLEKPKTDIVGIAEYEQCRKSGALIITAHDHAYARTKLMSSYETQTFSNSSESVSIGPGTSLAILQGLGGKSVIEATPEMLVYPWWQTTYVAPDACGALVCSFEEMLVASSKISCKFMTTQNQIVDQFSFTSR